MPTVYICACPVCGEVQEVANEKEQLKLYKKWHKAMLDWMKHIHSEYIKVLMKG